MINRNRNGFKQVGQMPMPPKVQMPQVYAQNPQCDIPNIDVMPTPQCNDPRKSVQVNKRVFEVISSEFWILDNGATLTAGFGPALIGKNAAGTQPTDLLFNLITDAQTRGVVRDVTIQFDSYAEDDADPRNLGVVSFQNYGVFEGEVGRSYSEVLSAFLSGDIIINNQPFPTKIPIAGAIKNTSNFDAYWDFGGIGALGYLPATPSFAVTLDFLKGSAGTNEATFNPLRFFVSPEFRSTHTQAPAPIEIDLPASSQYEVQIEIPTRAININATPTAYTRYSFVWTGIISILLEKQTNMGTLGVQYGNTGAAVTM